MQQGKGADMGAAFGSGASGTVFGAGGGGSFFSRATGILAAAFFANSILLSSPLVLGDRHPTESSIAVQAPVAPAPGTTAEEPGTDLPPADLPAPDTGDAAPGDLPAPAAVEPSGKPAADGAPKTGDKPE
jgi:preprotein translocase subunit SecG